MKILKTYEKFIAEKGLSELHAMRNSDCEDKEEELKSQNKESDEKQKTSTALLDQGEGEK